jgi:hypothetical protein
MKRVSDTVANRQMELDNCQALLREDKMTKDSLRAQLLAYLQEWYTIGEVPSLHDQHHMWL